MTMKTSHILLASVSIVLLALGGTLQAAVFCVTSSAELQAALDQADSNSQDDEIRVTQGTYPVPSDSPFRYFGGSSPVGDDSDLTITGGWVAFGGNPCGRRVSNATAFDTILDGENRERVMDISAGNQSDITISGLSFIAGNPSPASLGGGLYLRTNNNDIAGTFRVERSAFFSNTAGIAAAARISDSIATYFVNNLVVGNTALATASPIADPVVIIGQEFDGRAYVINNTIINNSADTPVGPGSTLGIRIFVRSGSQALVANNILWGNDFHDIHFNGDGLHVSRNNTIQAALNPPSDSENNVSIAPVFESGGFLNFNLVPGSPLANIGLNPPTGSVPFPPPFLLDWSLPSRDLEGNPRITDGTVDIGALETAADFIFSDRFE
jgi:hypothetical protein